MSIPIPHSPTQAFTVMKKILQGLYGTDELVAFLQHYQEQPAAGEILAAFLRAIQKTATFTLETQNFSLPMVDVAGTGGDGLQTVNISTLAGLFCAATSLVTVAKYGNKAASGICGSMDVLAAVGIDTQLNQAETFEVLTQHHFAPLSARNLYPGAKVVAEARSLVTGPTIFNLLFPLARPISGQQRFVLGVAKAALLPQFVELYAQNSQTRCAIVHGQAGEDEVSISGRGLTDCVFVDAGQIHVTTLDCQKLFGFVPADLKLLQIQTQAEAVKLFLQVCNPQLVSVRLTAIRQAVFANAAVALLIALEPGKLLPEKIPQYLVPLKTAFSTGQVQALLLKLQKNSAPASDFLSQVLTLKKQEVKALKYRQKSNRFAQLFVQKELVQPIIIAEIKPKSPSEGQLLSQDPVKLAQLYATGGADAISVLTDAHFFGGSQTLFQKIRANTTLPLLRKEFIIDETQLLESCLMGADAVLLIVKLLTPQKLRRLITFAKKLNLVPLVEITDLAELHTALTAQAEFIGVNARNLQTMHIDQPKALTLLAKIPQSKKRLLFSGIHTAADIQRAVKQGAQGVLIGTSLLKSPNPARQLKAFKESLQCK